MRFTGNYITEIQRATEWFDNAIEYISENELTNSDIDYYMELVKYLRNIHMNNKANMLEYAING